MVATTNWIPPPLYIYPSMVALGVVSVVSLLVSKLAQISLISIERGQSQCDGLFGSSSDSDEKEVTMSRTYDGAEPPPCPGCGHALYVDRSKADDKDWTCQSCGRVWSE